MASRTDQAMREEKREGRKERANRQRKEPRAKREEHLAKMAELCGKEKLGKESKALRPEGFKVGPG